MGFLINQKEIVSEDELEVEDVGLQNHQKVIRPGIDQSNTERIKRLSK
jgi:hypothetical protein